MGTSLGEKHVFLLRLQLILMTLVLLAMTAPLYSDVREVTSPAPAAGAQTVYGPNDYWGISAFNPTGIEVNGEYLLYVHTSTPVGPGPSPWAFCEGDQVVLFKAPATYDGIRGAFTAVERTTPCECPIFQCSGADDRVFGLGSVLRSQHDSNYYLVLESVVPTVNFGQGDFESIFFGVSIDGLAWQYPHRDQPLVAQSTICDPQCSVYSAIDATLIAEPTHWWGFFLWGTAFPSHVGRLRVFPNPSRPNGFLTQILSGGMWEDTNPDGTFNSRPDDVWPNARPNSLVKFDDRYELWASLSDSEDIAGCDDGRPGVGSTLAVPEVTQDEMKTIQPLNSESRAMPTRNLAGRITPHLAIDPGGARVLFSASSDRVCEERNQVWIDSGNPFAGIEVVSSVLSDSVVEDRFSERLNRPNGASLNGSATEIGAKSWTATAGLQINNNVASSNGLDNLIATVDFLPTDYPEEQLFSIEASIDTSGSAWTGIGFAQSSVGLFASGQVWMLIKPSGDYTVFVDGTSTPLVQGTAPVFFPESFNHLDLAYDAEGKTVSSSINGEPILENTAISFVPNITSAGVHMFDPQFLEPGVSRFDNFMIKVNRTNLFTDGFESGDTSRWSIVVN